MTRIRVMAGIATLAMVVMTGVPALTAREAPQDAKPAASAAPIELNAATAADLQKLPGVGPAMATRILDYRQKAGGFKKIEDLMNITGIGEKNFLKLKPLVTVAPAKTAER